MPEKRTTLYVLIPLTRGQFAMIDPEDAVRVCAYKWMATWSGTAWYANARINGRQVSLHRFLMNAEPGTIVDHANGDTLDYRKSNLRFATARQSVGNIRLRKDNTSGFRGVYWHPKANKWNARIHRDGRTCHLGLFATIEEAARAYDEAAREWFGPDFAQLNLPE